MSDAPVIAADAELQAPLAPDEETDRRIRAEVDARGWHAIHVPAVDGSSGWAFTVGLFRSFGHPEIAVFGQSAERTAALLGGLGRDVRAGQRYEPDVECVDVLPDTTCVFRPVCREWHDIFLGYAVWFYRAREFPVLQCIWTDPARRFPWDPGFRSDWLELQPLLFHASPSRAGVGPWLSSLTDAID